MAFHALAPTMAIPPTLTADITGPTTPSIIEIEIRTPFPYRMPTSCREEIWRPKKPQHAA
jgi:hypothetical protein